MLEWFETRPTEHTPPPVFRNLTVKVCPRDPSALIVSVDNFPQPKVAEIQHKVAGIHVAIEYRDAQGLISRRRITMRTLSNTANGVRLLAICHERRAARNFLLHRIRHFITQDGEILTPAAFWSSIGIDPNAGMSATDDAFGNAFTKLMSRQMTLLAAMANCDGDMHPNEVAAILSYIEISLEGMGVLVGPAEARALGLQIRRMRPTRDMVGQAARALFNDTEEGCRLSAPEARRFLIAASQVAQADTYLHPAEARLLDSLTDLFGQLTD